MAVDQATTPEVVLAIKRANHDAYGYAPEYCILRLRRSKLGLSLMSAMPNWVQNLSKSLMFVAVFVLAPAWSQPIGAPIDPPHEPSYEPTTTRGAPSCPDMGQILRRGVMLNTVDLPTVRRFYEAHGPECAWSSTNAKQIVDMVKTAWEHGIAPTFFHPALVNSEDGTVNIASDTERDIVLTDAALKYATIISGGLSIDYRTLDDAADRTTSQDLFDGLMDSLYSEAVRQWLTEMAPQYPAYVNLQAALAHYRQIADQGGWPQLPMALAKAKSRARVFSGLRTRLAIEGDLVSDTGSPRFDEELAAGLLKFQRRNGLRENASLDRKTIERLNVSAGERIANIALNLERLRVSLRDMPETRVEVNLPAATAILYRSGLPHLTMNVVVGAVKHETPELSSTIDSIVLNPPWNIPASIIRNEIKPLLKRDRNYLRKNHMYWLKDNLIQEPGPWNALGRIKFDFPNGYAVYLHDTPSRKLFTDPERAASHGCVRLERPVDLAVELLMGDGKWNRETIQAAIDQGITRRVRLENPMPVVIGYQTAFADADGTAHFRPDIYGRDRAMTLKLAARIEALTSEPLQW